MQEPPADFAERTTAAILRADRKARKRSGVLRSVLVGSIAAVLVQAAAWAMVWRNRAAEPVAAPPVVLSSGVPEEARERSAPEPSLTPAEPTASAAPKDRSPTPFGSRAFCFGNS